MEVEFEQALVGQSANQFLILLIQFLVLSMHHITPKPRAVPSLTDLRGYLAVVIWYNDPEVAHLMVPSSSVFNPALFLPPDKVMDALKVPAAKPNMPGDV